MAKHLTQSTQHKTHTHDRKKISRHRQHVHWIATAARYNRFQRTCLVATQLSHSTITEPNKWKKNESLTKCKHKTGTGIVRLYCVCMRAGVRGVREWSGVWWPCRISLDYITNCAGIIVSAEICTDMPTNTGPLAVHINNNQIQQ